MSKRNELIIVGIGETALLAYEYFTKDSELDVVAFAADAEYIKSNNLHGLPVVDIRSLPEEYAADRFLVFVAIGSNKMNRDRARLYRKLKSFGYKFASYISSKAIIWDNVVVGENCFVLEGNNIQPFVTVGDNVFIWSGNHFGHRTTIEDDCFISSHCVISGFCTLGSGSFLGVNCTIEDNVSIGRDNFIGAGALIQKSTETNSLYQRKQTLLSKVNPLRLFKVKEL